MVKFAKNDRLDALIQHSAHTWFVVVAVCVVMIINDVDIVFVFSLSCLLSL